MPEGLNVWPLDDKGMPGDPPSKGILPVIGESLAKRKDAEDREKNTMADYTTAIANITKAVDEFKKSTKDFQTNGRGRTQEVREEAERRDQEVRGAKGEVQSRRRKRPARCSRRSNGERDAAVRAKTKLEGQVERSPAAGGRNRPRS